MKLLRSLLLLLLLLTAGVSCAEPLKVCDVLSHLNQFEGRQVDLRGAVIADSHGTWLVPEKHCHAKQSGFLLHAPDEVTTWLAKAHNSKKKQKTVASFAGTITGWETPGKRGKKVPAFAATAVSDIRHQK